MPQTVEVPELGIVEFPDDMTPDSISAILRKRTQPKEPEPFPVIPPSPARTPEELSYRNMMGEQALGTAVPAPVAHGPLLDVPAALPETLIRASMKVPIPSLAQAIRLLPESEREPAIKGISESAAEGLSGLTTPENLAIGAGLAIAPEIGLPILVAHMQSQVPEALQAIDEAETPQQKWKARANLAQLAGMIVAPAAKPILKGLRGTERIEAVEQPVPPVIPRVPEPPPLPVEVPPEPPPPIPKPIERVVEDYVEPEPTETVVKGEEFAVPAKAAAVLPEAAKAAEEAGAKIEQPAAPSFAARFDPETLLSRPTWVEPGTAFDKALGEVRLNPEKGIDITPVWKTLTPEQRQELLARGWTVTDTRIPGQVVLGVSNDALAARKYFAVQARKPAAPAVEPEKGVTTDAERIREDTRLAEEAGKEPEGGKADRGYDVEQAAPVQPESLAARAEAPETGPTGAKVLLSTKEQAVSHILGRSKGYYDTTERRIVHASRESIVDAIDEAKSVGVRIEYQPPSKAGFAETWRIYDDEGNQALLQREPDGRTTWQGYRKTPVFTDLPSGKQVSVGQAIPEGRTGMAGEIARQPDESGTGQPQPSAAGIFGEKKEVTTPAKAKEPVAGVAKAQKKVQEVAVTEGKRSAKDIKNELIARIEEAAKKAPSEAELREAMRTATPSKAKDKSSWYTTIEIPEDGTFTVFNTKEALSGMLARAKRISMSEKPPGVNIDRSAKSLTDQATAASAAYGGPENAYRSVSRQIEQLREGGPPDRAEDRNAWNNQIEAALALQKEIYAQTSPGKLEIQAEAARDRVATYKEGALQSLQFSSIGIKPPAFYSRRICRRHNPHFSGLP